MPPQPFVGAAPLSTVLVPSGPRFQGDGASGPIHLLEVEGFDVAVDLVRTGAGAQLLSAAAAQSWLDGWTAGRLGGGACPPWPNGWARCAVATDTCTRGAMAGSTMQCSAPDPGALGGTVNIRSGRLTRQATGADVGLFLTRSSPPTCSSCCIPCCYSATGDRTARVASAQRFVRKVQTSGNSTTSSILRK